MPRGGFLCELQEWSSYRQIVRHEVTVVTSEAQESSYVSWCFWYWPVCYALKFLWAHFKMVSSYNYSEIFDFFFLKLALFGFEVEVILFELSQDSVDVGAVSLNMLFFGFVR